MQKRTALITGGSRGIGAAIAAAFKKAGIRTITPTRMEMDLASDHSVNNYFKRFQDPVDILINDAGINQLGSLEELRDGDLERVLKINLIAPLRLASHVAPKMKARKYGKIVNISSIFGIVTRVRRLTYTASKAGLIGLTRSLAVELAPHNVLVNTVAPGYVETDLTRQNNSAKDLKQIARSIPMQRLAQPQEIAETVLFLCSEKNSYITGQVLCVDGGFTCT